MLESFLLLLVSLLWALMLGSIFLPYLLVCGDGRSCVLSAKYSPSESQAFVRCLPPGCSPLPWLHILRFLYDVRIKYLSYILDKNLLEAQCIGFAWGPPIRI